MAAVIPLDANLLETETVTEVVDRAARTGHNGGRVGAHVNELDAITEADSEGLLWVTHTQRQLPGVSKWHSAGGPQGSRGGRPLTDCAGI